MIPNGGGRLRPDPESTSGRVRVPVRRHIAVVAVPPGGGQRLAPVLGQAVRLIAYNRANRKRAKRGDQR